MTRHALLLLLPFIVVLRPGVAQPADSLEVGEAVQRAAAHSRLLRISAARREAAAARAGEADALLLPSVKLEASYRRLSEVDPFQVSLPFASSPYVISPSIENNTSARVSVHMPLFAGFRLRNNAEAAAALAAAATAESGNDSGDVLLAAGLAYWHLYAARELRSALDSNILRLRSYEEDTERLLEAGLATVNDLLRVRVQSGSARLQQIDAASDEDLARTQLNILLGNGADRPIVLTSRPPDPADGPGAGTRGPDAGVVHRRQDLQAAEARVEAADRSLRAARGGFWPQIGLQGGYSAARPNPRILPAVDEYRSTWDAGVVLQFDVWNWGATAHAVDAAAAALRQAEAARDQLHDNVLLDVRRQALAVRRAHARVEVALLTLVQAEENLRSLHEKFRAGVATSTELLDADVALLQARTAAETARAEVAVAELRLQRAKGDLQ